MNYKVIVLTLGLVLGLTGFSKSANAQMPFPGSNNVWSVSAEGCPSAISAALAPQWATAATAAAAVNANEATAETNANTFVTADLVTIATAYPHIAINVIVSRSTAASSSTTPSSQFHYTVTPLPNFKGC